MKKIIAIDFDGTCVTHEFPKIGRDIGAVPVLQKMVLKGWKLVLFTMRSNCDSNEGFSDDVPEIHNGNFLDDAVAWFNLNNIPLWGIQVNPEQSTWTSSPKVYASVYIDDAALGCPLIKPKEGRPYVDWIKVEELLMELDESTRRHISS